MLSRRGLFALSAFSVSRLLPATTNRLSSLPVAFKHLEKAQGGRVGVAVLDTGTGERVGHRESERFPMCSTFKFLLATATLQRVDRHQEVLDKTVAIPPKPLLSHSPLTEPHAGGMMTISELCHAILTQSDNTGANLLLDRIGGPKGLTEFARSIGDPVTRLDRRELELNESRAGDPRDTTSPSAMVNNLKSVLLGNVLTPPSRDQITAWMKANLTGLERLRARLPQNWQTADKTGSNGEHTTNDIAVIWPAAKPPLIVAAYITQCPGPETKRSAMLAEIGRLVVELLV